MFTVIDRSQTRNEIRDVLLRRAEERRHPLSKARADKLAGKFKQGLFDDEMARVIGWSDPTGETACTNVMRAELATELAAA